MPVDIQSPSLCLGIVGTGAMGRGIAQIAAQAGIRVLLFDALHGAAANARETVVGTLASWPTKARFRPRRSPPPRPGWKSCATSTSSLRRRSSSRPSSKTSTSRRTAVPAAGGHHRRRLHPRHQYLLALGDLDRRRLQAAGARRRLPLLQSRAADEDRRSHRRPAHRALGADALLALGRRMGHTAVRAKDTPGFIVNHAGRGFVTEALRVLGEGVADFREVDCIMREAAGFRMGPFELMDLTGLDVSQPVMESIYHQYYQEAALPALADRGAAPHRRPARTQDRARLLRLRQWQGRGHARGPRLPTLPGRVWVSQTHPEWADGCARSPAGRHRGGTDYVPGEDALVHRHPAGRRRHHRLRRRRASTRAHRRHRLPVRHHAPARARAAA
jgi:3-hydroxybutyryl-CoA dehydrogenase